MGSIPVEKNDSGIDLLWLESGYRKGDSREPETLSCSHMPEWNALTGCFQMWHRVSLYKDLSLFGQASG